MKISDEALGAFRETWININNVFESFTTEEKKLYFDAIDARDAEVDRLIDERATNLCYADIVSMVTNTGGFSWTEKFYNERYKKANDYRG